MSASGAVTSPVVGMGIGDFYNQAFVRDFSRNFQMRVMSMGPNNLIDEKDNVYMTSMTLPGYEIQNQTVGFMGLTFNVPGAGHFPGSSSWQVTFRVDSQLNIREKFIGWQRSIFNSFPNDYGNSVGAYSPKGLDSTATLVILNRDGSPARTMHLIGVYPVTVDNLSYDATGNGEVVTMGVTLAYQWWQPYNI